MDNLVDTRSIKWDLLVVGIAQMGECEFVVTALIWLQCDFTARASYGLD